MKLYYVEDNKEKDFEAPIHGRVTSKLKAEFIKKLSELKQDENLQAQIDTLEGVKIEGGDVKAENMNLATLLKFSQLQKKAPDLETTRENDNTYLELVKIIIDTRTLEPKYKEMIETSVNSEFWQEQDINDIIKEVISFRSGLAS